MREETILSVLSQDHDRLDAIFELYQRAEELERAKRHFKIFWKGLRRHIVWEEEILFPIFEEKRGTTMGPTEVMRVEHREIQRLLQLLHEKLKHGEERKKEEGALLSLLSAHNEKEEHVLYPLLDQMLNDAERKSALEKIRDLPEEKLEHCCE